MSKDKPQESIQRTAKGTRQVQDSDSISISYERLGFLAKLPLLLNSSHETRDVIDIALRSVQEQLCAESISVFLLHPSAEKFIFWALEGEQGSRIEGDSIPSGEGITGWVVAHQTPLLVPKATEDSRFLSAIDGREGLEVKDLLCMPMTARGITRLGAIQVINKREGETFSKEDLVFLGEFSNQLAAAIDNARLYADLERRMTQLENLDRRKNEMIMIISHEFNTPLTAIAATSELLISLVEDEDPMIEEFTKSLNNSLERLKKLTTHVSHMAYLDAKQMALQKEAVVVNDILQEMAETFCAPLAQRNLKLKVNVDNISAYVLADRTLLSLTLSNLISNAIRFTQDGGEIVISTQSDSRFVQFSISDTGIGIPETDRDCIFDKFYEVGDALYHSSGDFKFKSGGLGLGLATVKAILDAHGSSIEVESKEEKGSTFRFSLPRPVNPS